MGAAGYTYTNFEETTHIIVFFARLNKYPRVFTAFIVITKTENAFKCDVTATKSKKKEYVEEILLGYL